MLFYEFMKTKVLVTDKLDESGIAVLKQGSEVDYKPGISPDDLKECIREYDALLVRSQTKATKEILESAGKMKIIGRAGVGVDNIDVETATDKGIIVVNSPEGNTIAAAEHTTALMMSLSRHIPMADKSCKDNKWERSKFLGTELNGQILGIVGLGKIGQRVGKVAKAEAANNVTINMMSPGQMENTVVHPENHKVPIGRLATLDEAVDACFFLIRSNYITGQNLELAGGWNL